MDSKRTARYRQLCEQFDDDSFNTQDRRFEIKKRRPIYPAAYLKTEWAIQVITLYNRGVKHGIVYDYPPMPLEKQAWRGQAASRARGGAAGKGKRKGVRK